MVHLLEPDVHIKHNGVPWVADDRKGVSLTGCSSARDEFHSVSTWVISYLWNEERNERFSTASEQPHFQLMLLEVKLNTQQHLGTWTLLFMIVVLYLMQEACAHTPSVHFSGAGKVLTRAISPPLLCKTRTNTEYILSGLWGTDLAVVVVGIKHINEFAWSNILDLPEEILGGFLVDANSSIPASSARAE